MSNTELIAELRDTASKGVSVWGDLQKEAADAIEVLQAEVERLKAFAGGYANENLHLQAQLAAAQGQLKHLPAAPIPQQPAPSVLIGEMRRNGVVWFNQNPHAWPLGTTYFAAAPQPKEKQ